MKVIVGSQNRVKVEAVQQTLKDYSLFKEAVVSSIEVSSDVSDQPMSLEEIIKGAKTRAFKAFTAISDANYSLGIESGLFEALGTETGYLEACITAIYDGKKYHIGLSCGFEVPPKILETVLEAKKDLSGACHHVGITSNPKLGASEGLIGILTGGRINRKEYTSQSIIMALAQLEHPKWYPKHG